MIVSVMSLWAVFNGGMLMESWNLQRRLIVEQSEFLMALMVLTDRNDAV